MSAIRQVPVGFQNSGLLNAQQIRIQTKPLAAIALSGSASDIKTGTVPVTSIPFLDGSIITSGVVPTAHLPASVQNSAATTDLWTGFNQHSVTTTNSNPMGTGGFLSFGRDNTGKTAFVNQPGTNQAGGWEFASYTPSSAYLSIAATLSASGTLMIPAINNGGAGLTIGDTIVMQGHAITGVTSLTNSGSGISIPENIALGGKGVSGISALSNNGNGVSIPENIGLGAHSISGLTQISNSGNGVSIPENVNFSGSRLIAVAGIANGGNGVSIPENIALGGHAITGLTAISNGGNGVSVNDNLIFASPQALAGISSAAISGSSGAPLTVFNPNLPPGGSVGMQLGTNALGANLTYTAASSSSPAYVKLVGAAGAGGLSVMSNGAVSALGTGGLLMRAFDESAYSSPKFSGVPIETRLIQSVAFGLSSPYSVGTPPYPPRCTNVAMRITGYLTAASAGTYILQATWQGQVRAWISNTLVFDKWAVAASATQATASIALPAAAVPVMIEFAGGASGGQLGLQVKLPGGPSFVGIGSAGALGYDMYEAAPSQFGTSQFNNGLIAPSLSNNGAGLKISEATSFAGQPLLNVSGVSNGGSGLSIPENVNFQGRSALSLASIGNAGGVSSSDPWYFNGQLNSSSIISFGQPPAASPCLLSLGSSASLTRSSTAFYGFGLAQNALAYQVPASSQDHVFMAGTAELGRFKGTGGVQTASINNAGGGVVSGEAWTFTNSIIVPSISNNGNGVRTSDTWSFTGLVGFGPSHTPAYAIDCNTTGFISNLITGQISNGGNGISIVDDVRANAYTITAMNIMTQGLTASGQSTLAAVGCTTLTNSGNETIAGTLAVTGGATLASTLAVTGSTTLATLACTSLANSGNGSISGTLTVGGAAALSSSLMVSGTATLAGATCTSMTNSGNERVNGSLMAGSLTVSGSTGLAGTTCTGILSLNNQVQNQLISLFTSDAGPSASSTNFYGFGINSNVLRYQVPAGQNHAWYVGGAEVTRSNGTGLGVLKSPTCALDVNGAAAFSGGMATAAVTCSSISNSGSSSLQAVTCTSINASGAVTVAGLTTLASVTASGNANVGGSLTVGGASSFANAAVSGSLSVSGTTTLAAASCTSITSSGNGSIAGTLSAGGACTVGSTLTQSSGNHIMRGGPTGGSGSRLQVVGGGGTGATVGLDLTTYGSFTNGWSITATDNGNFSPSLDFLQAQNQSSQTNVMHFNAGTGYLGLGGQTNPTCTLDIIGNVRATGTGTFSSVTNSGNLAVSGNLTVSGSSAFQAASCTTFASSGLATLAGNAFVGSSSAASPYVRVQASASGVASLGCDTNGNYGASMGISSNSGQLGWCVGSGMSMYAPGSALMVLNSSGQLGINNTNPSFNCDVTGTFRTTGAATLASLTSGNTAINGLLGVTGAGSMGSLLVTGNAGFGGLSSPAYPVDVNGVARSSQLLVGTSTDNASYRLISALNSNLAANGLTYLCLGQAASNLNQAELSFMYSGSGSSSNALRLGFYSGPAQLCYTAAGLFGVGTTSPAFTCDVAGSLRATGAATLASLTVGGATSLAAAAASSLTCTGVLSMNNQIANQLVCLFTSDAAPSSTSTNYYGFGVNSYILRRQVPTGSNHAWYAGTTELMRNNATGLGIFKSPTCALDVNGAIAQTGNHIISGGVQGGLGSRLSVYGAGNANATAGIDIGTFAPSSGNFPTFSLTATDSGSGTASLDVLQGTTNATSQVNRLHINASNGFIGLGGQTSPQAALDVTGVVKATSFLATGGISGDTRNDPLDQLTVLQYTFRTGYGTTVVDRSVSGNNGTISGNVTWSSSNPFDGLRGTYLNFADASGAITPANPIGTTTMTATCWYSPSALNTQGGQNVLFGNGPNRNLLEVQAS